MASASIQYILAMTSLARIKKTINVSSLGANKDRSFDRVSNLLLVSKLSCRVFRLYIYFFEYMGYLGFEPTTSRLRTQCSTNRGRGTQLHPIKKH